MGAEEGTPLLYFRRGELWELWGRWRELWGALGTSYVPPVKKKGRLGDAAKLKSYARLSS